MGRGYLTLGKYTGVFRSQVKHPYSVAQADFLMRANT